MQVGMRKYYYSAPVILMLHPTSNGTDKNTIPKQALQYKPEGRRNTRRPRKTRKDLLHLEA
jgi:hypothetical protein